MTMFKLFNNIFATEYTFNIAAATNGKSFNHCSSLCAIDNTILLAWYGGTGECRDDQSVYLLTIENHTSMSEMVRIGDKTGNPVVWPLSDSRAMLLYSKFEDIGPITRLADRWKYCSVWLQQLRIDNGITLLGSPHKLAGPDLHLLGRCNPITHRGQTLLPLYDEYNRTGVIYRGSGFDFDMIGVIGTNMIQPTLWEQDGKVCSLSRNFGNKFKMSQYSESEDGGVTWTEPIHTAIPNVNNSLHVVKWRDRKIILWNATHGLNRQMMTLGEINDGEKLSATKVKTLSTKYGAYPSSCVSTDGYLNFTFTTLRKTIAYHAWNYRKYVSERRRGRDTVG